MNEQITNPKVEVVSGPALNNKDYMNELLSGLKAMEKNYAVVLTEASNESLYQTYKKMFDEVSQLQRDVYELMFRYGWYPMEKAEANKVMQKHDLLKQEWMSIQ